MNKIYLSLITIVSLPFAFIYYQQPALLECDGTTAIAYSKALFSLIAQTFKNLIYFKCIVSNIILKESSLENINGILQFLNHVNIE